LLEQGYDMVNLTLAMFSQWVGEVNSLRGTKIFATTLAAYINATLALLEHWGMADVLCAQASLRRNQQSPSSGF
jgi:hypothetical protein